jgi:hypothetical protein
LHDVFSKVDAAKALPTDAHARQQAGLSIKTTRQHAAMVSIQAPAIRLSAAVAKFALGTVALIRTSARLVDCRPNLNRYHRRGTTRCTARREDQKVT